MIELLAILFFTGSIAEQQYIAESACNIPEAGYLVAFGEDSRHQTYYEDGSSVVGYHDYLDFIVFDVDGNEVYRIER